MIDVHFSYTRINKQLYIIINWLFKVQAHNDKVVTSGLKHIGSGLISSEQFRPILYNSQDNQRFNETKSHFWHHIE